MIAENAFLRYPELMRPQSPSPILRRCDLSALLVTNLVNIHYLSGVRLSAGVLLVRRSGFHLFVDGRYGELAEKAAFAHVRVHDVDMIGKALDRTEQCGVESRSITIERFRMWKRKYKNTKFVRTVGIIEEFRRQKDAQELSAFRRSQRITQELLRRVPSALNGIPTERELAWKLRTWAHELGAEDLAFDPIVAFGTHTSRPHHQPTDRRFKRRHVVQVDVGVRYGGYCSDQSMVILPKNPTVLECKIYAAVDEAKRTALQAVRAGVTNWELDRVARRVLKRHGLEEYFPHALGHGVGLEVHEGITLSSVAPKRSVLTNEIVTIEPGIYIPGKCGMRLEQEIIVRD
ncbi:hypothetical protein COU80_00560 [Candidatus Peregrinibacteria bacterium CG10_big_fil_rev_8_21_14_0_10_55_24]|nr:MAG: hypothetical protein COU80_00560 [Candidatus Peregrinibacteria bacterium CG10_big_fil_rev_8_21_14_0_10_55_24]